MKLKKNHLLNKYHIIGFKKLFLIKKNPKLFILGNLMCYVILNEDRIEMIIFISKSSIGGKNYSNFGSKNFFITFHYLYKNFRILFYWNSEKFLILKNIDGQNL